MLAATRNAGELTARWSVIGLGFFIPVSVAADNLLLLLAIVGWLLAGGHAQHLRRIRAHPVALAALCIAGVMALGMTWSPQPFAGQKEAGVEILRFALLGVLLTLFSDARTRERAKNGFLLASVLVLAVSFVLWSGAVERLPGVKGTPAYPVVFKFHITHNVLMAFAAVLFVLRATDSHGRRRGVYAALAALAAFNVFFMVPGRTGQLALAAVLVYVACSRYRWIGMAVAGTGLAGILAAVWLLPGSVMHQRTSLALTEAQQWKPGQAQPQSSSIGMRLEFYGNTLHMIAERPLIGAGTGSFPLAYAQRVAGTSMVVANHPHNAFLLVGAELGLIGLAAFGALLAVQWRSAHHLPGATDRIAARALLIVFVAAGMVSSTFNDHAEGLFYIWASALLWAGLPREAAS